MSTIYTAEYDMHIKKCIKYALKNNLICDLGIYGEDDNKRYFINMNGATFSGPYGKREKSVENDK